MRDVMQTVLRNRAAALVVCAVFALLAVAVTVAYDLGVYLYGLF
jgi:hypothetical protein